MDIQNPQQPNQGGQQAPQQPAQQPAQPQQPTPDMPQMSNMQNAPLFTDAPVKKSNSAIIILVVVIVLVIVAGVIFFMMSNRSGSTGPVVDGQVQENTGVNGTQQGGAFGQQQTSNRDLNSGADITSELNDVNAELEQLNIDDFEEEFAEIDQILQDINI